MSAGGGYLECTSGSRLASYIPEIRSGATGRGRVGFDEGQLKIIAKPGDRLSQCSDPDDL
jgi:hypothetical protein